MLFFSRWFQKRKPLRILHHVALQPHASGMANAVYILWLNDCRVPQYHGRGIEFPRAKLSLHIGTRCTYLSSSL